MARWHEGSWALISDVLSPEDREGGPFRAYEPDPLLGCPFALSVELLLQDAVDFEQLICELGDVGVGHERLLLRLEAIASSRLSRLMISSCDVALAELVLDEPRVVVDDAATREVLDHIGALRAAVEELASDAQITVAGIDHVQRLLLADRPHLQGLREEQNWVGGAGPVGARYVPPPPQHVPDLLADLAAYLNTDDDLILVQAARAYAQLLRISAPSAPVTHGWVGC